MVIDMSECWLIDSYFTGENGKRISWKLSQPALRENSWQIIRFLHGIDSSDGTVIVGADVPQVVRKAFELTRIALEQSGSSYLHEGRVPLQWALPRFVPFQFGSDVTDRIEKYIDGEDNLWNKLVELRRCPPPDLSEVDELRNVLLAMLTNVPRTAENIYRFRLLIGVGARLFSLGPEFFSPDEPDRQ